MISAKDLIISFGNETIISKLNFEIKKGEKVCITGISGSGKTTLLYALGTVTK